MPKSVPRKVDEKETEQLEDVLSQGGITLGSLVKWNSYLDRIRMDGQPLTPFANQIAFLRSDELEVLYGGASRGGKGVTRNTRIVTPFGYRKMEDIKKGDLISTPFGTNTRVMDVYDRGEQDVYKFTFQDGRTVICDSDHLWKVKKTHSHDRKTNRNNPEDGNYVIWNTKEILEWMEENKKTKSYGTRMQQNLLIPLCRPVQFTKSYKVNMIRIDPYVMGVLLSDGCISNEKAISIAGIDNEIFDEVRKITGWTLREDRKACRVVGEGLKELREHLKTYKLIGKTSKDKFVPEYYKTTTIENRIALIQGLMDTDGYVDSRGHLSYTTISEQLAKDVQWVIRSLGGRASITTKIPTYTHNEIKKEGQLAYTVWIQTENKELTTRLSRKKERCTNKEYMGGIVEPCLRLDSVEYIGKEPTMCLRVEHPQGLFLVEDFIVTHNSVALLMAAAQYVDVPGYNAIIFRRSSKELSKGDGLIPLSMLWFNQFKNEGVKWDDDNKQWKFPNGSILGFGYLESERDKYNYIGQAYQFIGYDELTQQPYENYNFLFSRLVRNKTLESYGVPLRVRSTTNPNGQFTAWVHDRFINKRTRPNIRNKIIELAHQRVQMGYLSEEEINEEYIKYRMPKFISSLAKDNPHIDMATYLNSLDNLDPVTRAQLLRGDWDIRTPGNLFSRDWFEQVPLAKVPVNDLIKVRYWDLAATKHGDYTASCHLGCDKRMGLFYILDMTLFKMTPAEIEKEVKIRAEIDGPETTVYMEREPGSAGIHNIDHYKRKVIPPGVLFKEDRVTGDKDTRARPASAAAEKGILKIAWTRACDRWYDPVMEQLELFPDGEHDDAVDALASAFNVLSNKVFTRGKYIGKMDWLGPEFEKPPTMDEIIAAETGKKNRPTLNDILSWNKRP